MSQANRAIITLILTNLILGGIIWYLSGIISPRIPEVFVEIPYQSANIVVDLSLNKGLINPFWRGFAQGGEEARPDMLTAAVEPMRTLEPSYVRLDHIFDDDYYGVVSGSPGNLSFNWSRLDKAVADIQSMGAKPFFSLGYMPSVVAPSKIDPPYNWNDWFLMVKNLVEHYSGQKGIEGIYYEVWNEPDLQLFGGWERGGDKDYLTLYEYAARGAMAAKKSKPFYLGGPATTGLYKNWTLDLYKFCGDKGLRLDFLSWHQYDQQPQRFYNNVADLYSWFDNKPIPRLVISEWGSTPEKSDSYSSAWAASHAFATVRQLLDLVALTTVFEIKDGPGQGDQGWGLLRHETVGLTAKPRYQAFQWLAEAKGQRLSLTGEGSNLTGWATRQGNRITTWLVNFGEGATIEGVPVEIRGLDNGSWQLTKEVLFGNKQNLNLTITDNLVKTTLELKPNEVGRVILVKS